MSKPRILSVGQCGVDHPQIERFLGGTFGADVTPADTAEEATVALRSGGYDLVLVNRVFDRDGGSGLDFIRSVKADDALASVPVMLVSNHDDAQSSAVEAGALDGFGKAALGTDEASAKVRDALSREVR